VVSYVGWRPSSCRAAAQGHAKVGITCSTNTDSRDYDGRATERNMLFDNNQLIMRCDVTLSNVSINAPRSAPLEFLART
jgi:hypothetical protein